MSLHHHWRGGRISAPHIWGLRHAGITRNDFPGIRGSATVCRHVLDLWPGVRLVVYQGI